MPTVIFKTSNTEKEAYSYAAHEARMTMSEWIRVILDEAISRQESLQRPIENIDRHSVIMINDIKAAEKWANDLYKQ